MLSRISITVLARALSDGINMVSLPEYRQTKHFLCLKTKRKKISAKHHTYFQFLRNIYVGFQSSLYNSDHDQ